MRLRGGRCIAVMLVAASAARAETLCIGDCGGDGAVGIDDLIVGVEALLSGDPTAGCAAWDPDHDNRVRVDDLVRGVGVALAGPCHASPTPTATPTVPADPLLALIQPAWADACTPMGGPLLGENSAGPDGLAFYCMASPGHDNHTSLHRYASIADATAAFAAASAGFEPVSFRDLPTAFDEQPFEPGGDLGGAYRTLVWQLGCWVAMVASFDDTSYRFAPDPFTFSAAIVDAAGAALLARCDLEPTPTPTPMPTATPLDPLFAAIRAPWESACTPFSIGAYSYAYPVDEGYVLACERSAGHGNATELHRYASEPAAADAFASAGAGFEALPLEGLPAAFQDAPFPPGHPLDGKQRTVLWQLDCWLARVRSYDDTEFRIAPDPVRLSHRILSSAGDLLRAACGGATSAGN